MRIIVIACYAMACCAVACGQVIENEDVAAVSRPGGIALYVPRLPDECVFRGCAFIAFAYDGESIVWNEPTPHLGPRGDWFVVPSGSAFGPTAVKTGAYSPLFSESKFNKSYPLVHVGPGDFYLGVAWSGAYGWVHLAPVDGALAMLGNAMAYNSRGIIVGTTSLVPEPMTGGILLVGLATIGIMLRRSRKGIRKH